MTDLQKLENGNLKSINVNNVRQARRIGIAYNKNKFFVSNVSSKLIRAEIEIPIRNR